MKFLKHREKSIEILDQYMVFKNIIFIANIIYWPYYYINLHKHTDSFSDILVERSIFLIGCWIGYIVFSFLVDRYGYLRSYKMSFLVQIVSFSLTLLAYNSLNQYYIFLAIVNGFGYGSIWASMNTFNLKELHGVKRGYVIDVLETISRIEHVILPVFAGALISFTEDFRSTVIITIIIYLLILIYP